MKALTIRQPWVHAILHEGKDIENRSRRTNLAVGWQSIVVDRRTATLNIREGIVYPSLLPFHTLRSVALVASSTLFRTAGLNGSGIRTMARQTTAGCWQT